MGRPLTKGDAAAAGVLFLGAFAVRLVGVNFGLPYMYYWDEGFIVSPVKDFLAAGQLLPHFYGYPSGYIYLQCLAAPISYIIFILKNGPAPPAATALSDYLLVGRSLTAALGAAAVALVYWFVVRMWRDRLAGVIAGVLLALSPLSIADSRVVATDVPMAAAAFLGVFLLLLYLERGDWKTLVAAGTVAGVAVGLKYNAAFFAAVAAVLVAIRARSWRPPAVFAGVAAGAFLILVPGIIFEHGVFFQNVLMQSNFYFVTGEAEPKAAFTLWHYAGQLWSYGLTPVPFIFAAFGLALFVSRHRKSAVTFLAIPAPYVIFLAFHKVDYARNLEPLLPYGAAFAGLAGAYLLRGVRRKIGFWAGNAAITVLAAAFLFRLVIVTTRETVLHVIEDDRTRAKEWFEVVVPWPQRVAKEALNPAPQSEGGQTDTPPIDADEYDIRVGPYIAANSAEEYAAAGFVFLVTQDLKANSGKLEFADPCRADEYRRNYESIINNSDLVLAFKHSPNDFRPSVEIYRLTDDVLRMHNPPHREVEFERGWVRSEECSCRTMPKTGKGFLMETPSRAGAYFTAPSESFVVTVRAERLSGEPRLAVVIDGETVAEFAVRGKVKVATSPSSAPPYFKHLIVRCAGPPGSCAALKRVTVNPVVRRQAPGR